MNTPSTSRAGRLFDGVLPQVQEARRCSGRCRFSRLKICRVSGLSDGTVALLQADFPDMAFETMRGHPKFFANLETKSPGVVPSLHLVAPDHREGYRLRIATERVQITARDAAGLWYGFQTLLHLRRESGGAIPSGDIRDWPAVAHRGIHLDLKGCQPRFPRLLEICRMLSSYKINTILLEIEDKYRFKSAPDIGIDSAYTFKEMRQLSRLCADMFIQVIPKLQCLGHVDYILKHRRYRRLRENKHPYQFCPRNPAGFALWKGMAVELMDVFREHDAFHLGADETSHLGECPICRRHSRAECYIHRVGQCLDLIESRKKRAMMWDDILRNLHGNLDADEVRKTWVLGRRATLAYWAYGYGGKDNEFPFLSKYIGRGLTVWGASGFSGCGPSWIQDVPPIRERALNIAAWTRAALKHRLEGIIATGWTRICSADPPAEPIDTCWFTILYAAESMWRGRERGLEEFCRVASKSLFGNVNHAALVDHLLSDRPPPWPAEGAASANGRNSERYALILAALRLTGHEKLRQTFHRNLRMYHGRLGRVLPDYRLKLLADSLAAFRQSLDGCRQRLQRALAPLYKSSTVVEIVESRFGFDRELAANTQRLIKVTRLM